MPLRHRRGKDAAGRNSAGYRRLADQLEDATGLTYDPVAGDLIRHFRRSAGHRKGWDEQHGELHDPRNEEGGDGGEVKDDEDGDQGDSAAIS